MFILVCYDVETVNLAGRRRLRRVAKLCESHGQRAQKSAFECRMERALFLEFEHNLRRIIDPKCDSLRIYPLDEAPSRKVRSYGKNDIVDYEKPLIV